jgi:NADH-ubiquinone oxidoreductase chain 6
MLYIVNEMTFSGYNVYSLNLLYIIAILLGILVIISKNPDKIILWDQLSNSGDPLKLFDTKL